jgi:hypothetical protein
MLKHSPHPWYIHSPSLVSSSQGVPSWEKQVESTMAIPIYTPTRDERGHAVWGEPRWLTREEAERWVGPKPEYETEERRAG